MSAHSRQSVDDIVERLRTADVREYRESTFLGFNHGESAYPILLPDRLWESGIWVLGAARSGKTQRVLASLAMQRIRRNDSPVVIFDCKGDDAFLQSTKREAEAKGRELIILTNVSRFSTRLFNPLAQRHLSSLSRVAITEQFLSALNLFFGFGYGKSYFGGQSYQGFSGAFIADEPRSDWGPAIASTRATSFVQLAKRLPEVLKNRPELRGAEALTMVIRQLADVFILNAGCSDIYPESAVKAGIQVGDLLKKSGNGTYPILYCYLRAESEPVSTSVIAKLVLNLLKNALRQMRDGIQEGEIEGPAPVVPVFIDECQVVLDDALRNMLEQGASLGLQFVLANQDISQLRSGDRDFFPTVWENCGNKIILTSRDHMFQEILMKLSGEKPTHHLSYAIGAGSLARGRVGADHAVDGVYKVAEMISPRWERNHIIEMSATPGLAMFIPSQDEDLAQYRGYPIMVDLPFLHSRSTFEHLKSLPWPEPRPETLIPNDYLDRWEEFLATEFRPKTKTSRKR